MALVLLPSRFPSFQNWCPSDLSGQICLDACNAEQLCTSSRGCTEFVQRVGAKKMMTMLHKQTDTSTLLPLHQLQRVGKETDLPQSSDKPRKVTIGYHRHVCFIFFGEWMVCWFHWRRINFNSWPCDPQQHVRALARDQLFGYN